MSGGGDSNAAGNEENILDDILRPSFHDEDDHLFGTVGAGNDHKNDDDDGSTSDSSADSDARARTNDRGGGGGGGGHSDISDDESDKGGRVAGGSNISDDDDDDAVSGAENKSAASKRRRVEMKGSDKRKSDGSDEDHESKVRSGRDESKAAAAAAAKKKKGKSYDYATKLNYLFRDARFFVVKSNNAENVAIAKAKSVWSTPPQNEARLNKAFEEVRNVLLVFSVKESGKFAGLARLATPSARTSNPIPWVLPPGLSARALGGVFTIDWICRKVRVMYKNVCSGWGANPGPML
jgi:hypothetical protein